MTSLESHCSIMWCICSSCSASESLGASSTVIENACRCGWAHWFISTTLHLALGCSSNMHVQPHTWIECSIIGTWIQLCISFAFESHMLYNSFGAIRGNIHISLSVSVFFISISVTKWGTYHHNFISIALVMNARTQYPYIYLVKTVVRR